MPDVFSKKKRSEIMSRVRSKNTKPELFLRSSLHKLGFRFRIHSSALPGKPDMAFKKYGVALFVNGCFWHGHGKCRKSALPATRRAFWRKKIETNKMRDRRAHRKLNRLGWRVIVVWECQLMKRKQELVMAIAMKIKNGRT
jgi:DNA mismatch endonuclease (patch repair protein)